MQKSLKEHVDLIRHKDELIIQLRSANFQLNADLDKANEILLESETRIEHLQSELNGADEKRRALESLLQQEIRKNQVISKAFHNLFIFFIISHVSLVII